MKSKHTPGPWEFVPEVSEIRTVYPDKTSMYGNGTPIGGIFDLNTNYEQQYANARLIAVAPEMYDLLDTILVFASNGTIELTNEIINDLERVLNKVSGGAQ